MKHPIISLLALVPLAGLAAAALDARQASPSARTKVDLTQLGPKIGERVPDFSLKDQNGRLWTRQSILGPKGAMLVFVRSADW